MTDTSATDATRETLISVDIEASGPTPSTGSLIALGACLVDDPGRTFYVEIRPLDELPWDEEAERVHRLSRGRLSTAADARTAMRWFAAWVDSVAEGTRPVMVGFNAPFDWMFVADYLHRFVGRNPFGISALDIKAYYMGRERVEHWGETTKQHVRARYATTLTNTHDALDDARAQAELVRVLRGT